MEGFLVLVAVFFGIWIVRVVLSAGAKATVAVARTAVGRGSLGENMDRQFVGMGALSLRIIDKKLGDDADGLAVKELQVKGILPVNKMTEIEFVTSVFDCTEDVHKPVISTLSNFQEPTSVIFQHSVDAGTCDVDQGMAEWAPVGVIIPDILQPPENGTRSLCALVRLVDSSDPPEILGGLVNPAGPRPIWADQVKFSHDFDEKGYEQASSDRDEAVGVGIKIAVAVAMADGDFDDSEGEVIQSWISKSIEPFSGERRETLKSSYNTALRDAYSEASNGELTLSNLISRLNELGESPEKYETIELCLDVMAADGIAGTSELEIVRKIGNSLGLDLDEMDRLRDQRLVGLNSAISDDGGVEALLGIDSSWGDEEVRNHLRSEFQKWSNRLNTLPEGQERQNAQRMIDSIGEAKKRYG